MAEDFRAGATRSLHLTGELITLTKAFAKAEIPVLPHKGPLLAQAAYGDLALRQFNDLDLLVHPADLPRAIALLAKLGYLPPSELAWLSPRALRHWTGEMSYTSQHGTAVDLHWRLTPIHYTVQLDPEILWRNIVSIRIAGSELPSLGPEALLLLLAVHGAKHCWESIGWLADVAWLLDANPHLDWQFAMKLADESSCQRPLLLAASLVARGLRRARAWTYRQTLPLPAFSNASFHAGMKGSWKLPAHLSCCLLPWSWRVTEVAL